MDIQLQVLEFFQSIKNPILDVVFTILTISTEVPIIVVFAAAMYWCINKRNGQRLLFSLTTNIAINSGIKELIKSPRPIGVDGINSMRQETATGYAFPSGHTQTATTFWTSLIMIYKNKSIITLGLIMILGVGISRLYLGVHWPVDVIGGWIFGVIFTIISIRVFDKANESKNYLLLILYTIPFGLYAYVLQSESYTKMFGLLTGFVLGYIVEDKFVNFKTINNYNEKINFRRRDIHIQENYNKSTIYRFLLGMATLAVVYVGLEYLMIDGMWYGFLKYALLTFCAVGVVPVLFKIFKLS